MKISISEQLRAWMIAPILEEIRKVEKKMSQLSDAITAVSAGITALGTQLSTVATDLQTEIAEINAKIAAGTVTQADLDSLSALATTLSGMSANVTQLDTDIKNIIP